VPSYHNAKRQSSQDASQSPPGDPPAPFVSGESQGTRLLRLVPNIELFLTPEGRPFATIEIDGHEETHRIRSSTFRSYLHHLYFSHYDRAICTNALEETVGSLEARACSEGRVVAVYLRFGENGRKSYVDLGNERWEAVEISPSGKWKIVKRPAIKFWRSRGTLALPRPVRGQDGAGALRRLVNVKTDDQFHLIVAWSLGAMRPRGPHPILVLNSEQGSGKTTIA